MTESSFTTCPAAVALRAKALTNNLNTETYSSSSESIVWTDHKDHNRMLGLKNGSFGLATICLMGYAEDVLFKTEFYRVPTTDRPPSIVMEAIIKTLATVSPR
jgi:hypothetical protein